MNTREEEWELLVILGSSCSTRVVKIFTSFILPLIFQSLFHVILGIQSENISNIGFQEADIKVELQSNGYPD